MNRFIYIFLFIIISCSNSNGTANNREINVKYSIIDNEDTEGQIRFFVGYKNDLPVFNFPDINSLFVYDNGFTLIEKYNKQYSVLLVKESVICYKTDNEFIVYKNDKKNVYNIKDEIPFIASNEKSVFFTDINTLQIMKIEHGSVKNIGVKGFVICCYGNYLYYTKESTPDLMHANVDIYRINILSSNNKKIAKNFSGEATYIIPNGKFIYDNKLLEGEFKPIIYNVEDDTYSFIEINFNEYEPIPYYSFTNKCLVFYNSKKTSFKYIELPE